MSDLPAEINWTPELAREFKISYLKSQKRPAKTRAKMFMFKGYQFIPGYAKYLLEFLDEKFQEA